MRERGQGTLEKNDTIEVLFVRDTKTEYGHEATQVSGTVTNDNGYFLDLISTTEKLRIPWSDILVVHDTGADEWWKGDEYYPGSEDLYNIVLAEGDIPFDPPDPPRTPWEKILSGRRGGTIEHVDMEGFMKYLIPGFWIDVRTYKMVMSATPKNPFLQFYSILPMLWAAGYIAGKLPWSKQYKDAFPVQWYDLPIILGLFTWDDWGTAVGFQSSHPRHKPQDQRRVLMDLEEILNKYGTPDEVDVNEGNPIINEMIFWMVDNGYAANESQAMVRLSTPNHLAIILAWYKGGLNTFHKIMLYLLGITKAWAGHGWHGLENEFSYWEAPMFLFGSKGKPTPYIIDITIPNPK